MIQNYTFVIEFLCLVCFLLLIVKIKLMKFNGMINLYKLFFIIKYIVIIFKQTFFNLINNLVLYIILDIIHIYFDEMVLFLIY